MTDKAKDSKPEDTQTAEKADTKAVATTQAAALPAVVDELEAELLADAGAGSEGITMDHLTVPFLSVLQQLSPQVQKGSPTYITGAEASMIMNTMNKKLYKANVAEQGHNGIVVAAVHFDPKAIEWKPRGTAGGGGLVKVWGDDDSYTRMPAQYEFSKEKNRWISKDGNEVSDHFDTYVCVLGYLDENKDFVAEAGQAILSCKGSQIKKSKQWNSERMSRRITVAGKSIQPPHWYQTYVVQTRFESNDKGAWFGWDISPYKPILELDPSRGMYAYCKELHANINAGKIKVDEEARLGADAGEGGGGELAAGGDIPF